MTSPARTRQILQALTPGKPVSGTLLAQRIGVSRMAVFKHVDGLRKRGVPIAARGGKGYSLPWPTQLLDASRIAASVPVAAEALEVHWELDSSQSELARRREDLASGHVVLSEYQFSGRGRRGRTWLAPPGYNLCLSCLQRLEAGFGGLSGLSLAIGVAVARALEELGASGVALKWPNDVVTDAGKLAGILVELSGEMQGPCVAIVGVGINVRLPESLPSDIGQAAADLALACGEPLPDRNELAACMVRHLQTALEVFATDGFAAFADAYGKRDWLYGKPLRLTGENGAFCGTGRGVDENGALRVATETETVHVDSAQVTVRAQ